MNLTYTTINGIEYTMRRSKYAANYSPVIVSDNMSGKMSGIPSISTCVLENPICQKRRQDPNSICSKWFAASTAARYSSLAKNLKSNLELLTGEILHESVLPRFIPELSNIVRFESFGDLISDIQFENYLNLTEKNPGTTFTIWSKNMWIMRKVFKYRKKPKNLIIVYSSPAKNKAVTIDQIKAVFPFVDKTFTVYSKEYAIENGIKINCGNKKCIECRCCYNKRSKVNTINELLK